MTGSTMTALAAMTFMYITWFLFLISAGFVFGFHLLWAVGVWVSWEWWFLSPFIAPLISGLIGWRLWQVAD